MDENIRDLQVKIDQYAQRIEELEKKNEAFQIICHLLPVISHEFRTALSPLCGFPLLLLETPLTPKQRKYTEIIRDAGRHLLRLVNDYLEVMTIEAGQMIVDLFPLDVCEMIESVVKQLTEQAAQKGIVLTSSIAPDVPPIIISDRRHVQEVLSHLITFALKLIDHGTVFLSVICEQSPSESPAYTLNFSVHETGVYRAPQQVREQWLNEIQEFFAQKSAMSIPVASDVELVLSRQVSDLLGGTLWLERQPETHSTTFHFLLPCEVLPPFNGRIIAVVGERKLRDEDFCNRMVSLSQNAEDAWFGDMMTDRFSTTSPYSITSPLLFSFSKQPVRFLQNTNLDESHLRSHLLSQSHGVIVSLSGRALDVEYLAGNDRCVISLKKALNVVYEAHQPTIFVIEDIRDRPVEIQVPAKSKYIQDGTSVVKLVEEQPSAYFRLEDDIWQTHSPTMQRIREILNIPERIPMLPYTHDKTASLEHTFMTLLGEIENTYSKVE